MEGDDVQGRTIKAGYWTAGACESGVRLTLGCHRNYEFWANVTLSEADLREMLRQVEEARAAHAAADEGLTEEERAGIPY